MAIVEDARIYRRALVPYIKKSTGTRAKAKIRIPGGMSNGPTNINKTAVNWSQFLFPDNKQNYPTVSPSNVI
jgi:hypothetical protein